MALRRTNELVKRNSHCPQNTLNDDTQVKWNESMNGGKMDAFRVGQPISAVPAFDSFDSCVPAESELRKYEGWIKSDRHPQVIPREGYLWTIKI